MKSIIIFLILTFGLNLIASKVFASESSDVLQFHVKHIFLNSSKNIPISKNLFSKEMANSVDSIKTVYNVNKVDHNIISFSVVDTSDNRFDNIQCFIRYYSYAIIGGCKYVNIHFSDCGNDVARLENDNISILHGKLLPHDDHRPRNNCPLPYQ